MAFVYVALNLVNDKIYVGATEKEVRVRRQKHFANAIRGQDGKFYNAIRKHGTKSFVFLVIHRCADFFEALELERAYIRELKPEYNLTEGGGGVKGLQFSDESKQKMRAAKVGRPSVWSYREMPEHMKADLIRRTKKRCLGNPITDPKRIAELKLMTAKGNQARRRKVRCLESGNVFNSVTDAAKHFRVSTGHITNWCSGMRSRRGIRLEYHEAAS